MTMSNIPGISFDVIKEGLIGTPVPGSIGVLLVGTACKGPVTPQFFGSDQLDDLLTMYGPPDPYSYKTPVGLEPPAELTLARAAIEIYNGGPPPGGLWCVRVAESSVVKGNGIGLAVSHYDTILVGTPPTTYSTTTSDWVILGDATVFTGIAVGDRIEITGPALSPILGTYFVRAITGSTSLEVYPIGDADGFAVAESGDVAYSAYGPIPDGAIKFTAKYSGQWYNNLHVEFVPFQNLENLPHGAVDYLKFEIPSNRYFDSYNSVVDVNVSHNRWHNEIIPIQLGELGSKVRKTITEIVTGLNANTNINRYWDVTFTGAGTKTYIDITNEMKLAYANTLLVSEIDGVSSVGTGTFVSALGDFIDRDVRTGDRLVITDGTSGNDAGTYTVITRDSATQLTVTPNFPSGDTADVYEVYYDSVGGTNWSSDDSSIIAAVEVKAALSLLLVKSGQILVIGGADEVVGSGGYIIEGIIHVKSASVDGADNERVFVCGTSNYSNEPALIAAFESSPYPLGEERAISVTPGFETSNLYLGKIYGDDGANAPNTIKDTEDNITLSGGYSAARIAGMLSGLIPDRNILNKTFTAVALEFAFGKSTTSRAINQRFTVLSAGFSNNFVVRRALTSAPDGDAFAQISTILSVDSIRRAVRLALANFIGTKNNTRVRQIMTNKTVSVMDGFISREIVQSGFTVSITATRDQEIAGAVEIFLRFKVVFYIEFINVKLLLE